MERKKIISLCLILILLTQLFLINSCAGLNKLIILDCNSKEMAQLSSSDPRTSFEELVVNEAAKHLAEIKNCSEKKAKKLLFRTQHTIYTTYDPDVYRILEETYTKQGENLPELGCAITDINGGLLALFSASSEKIDRSVTPAKPYAAISPLTVYAPAINSRKIHYSSAYLDNALLKVQDKAWPANPNGTYTYKKIPLVFGISQGLPTLTVRALKECSIDTSLEFLESLGIEPTLTATDETTRLSALALGEQDINLSPLEMAGYYRIFANGGRYSAPHTITQINDKEGILYENSFKEENKLSESAAEIVNQMLIAATAENGIAKQAKWGDVPVSGMVASGEEGNWFVGLTPAYSCAVWHGNESKENRATAFFAEALSKLEHGKTTSFYGSAETRKAVFCKESGLLFGSDCTKMQMGYYFADALPEKCPSNH